MRLDNWQLAPDPQNQGREEQWFTAIQSGAQPAPVPGIIQQVFPGFHGVAWYWTTFTLAPLDAGERALLRFGAVDYLADVWVNGVHVGRHEGGETPFTLDATTAVDSDKNLLAVRVVNPGDERIDDMTLREIPHGNKYPHERFMPGCRYNYGGLLLPVELVVAPAVRVTDIFARPDLETGVIAVTVTVWNDLSVQNGMLQVTAGPAMTGEIDVEAVRGITCPPGESSHEYQLVIAHPQNWELDTPFLYSVQADLLADDGHSSRKAVRCGFRDFRVIDGWFYLNGKRLFLKSTHTGNHMPVTQVAPAIADFAIRDLLYAKSLGFNMVRFISGLAWPEQLDCADEIGLLVYEEHLAGWCLDDSHAGKDSEYISPHMAERFDFSTREMIQRDRNHPSVVIWGLLNETREGPVFHHAVRSLEMVRGLDETRLVLLHSGRWDCRSDIGSLSNPGSNTWEHLWGNEAPGHPQGASSWSALLGGYAEKAGDAHTYPAGPIPREAQAAIRALGHDTKPVFLSEGGMGSLFNVVDEGRRYGHLDLPTDLPDRTYITGMRMRLEADWQRWKMHEAYPFLEDMLRDSYRQSVRQRRLFFDLVRSNPKFCGYNLTGILDHGLTGEGVWTFWREFKPGIADCMRDGWAPLRWCLFATPEHGYAGQPLQLEAVLANEDILPPGSYPVTFRLFGPNGLAWEKRTTVVITPDRPLATPVLAETIRVKGPAGDYTFAASMEAAAPMGDRLTLRLADREALSRIDASVMTWGIDAKTQRWLVAHGITNRLFDPAANDILLIGQPREKNPATCWNDVTSFAKRGGTVVCLSPRAFAEGDNPIHWLPLRGKLNYVSFWDWLYHREHIARPHPVMNGLQAPGLLDWNYYGDLISHQMFQGTAQPTEAIIAAFTTGYCKPTGYDAGIALGAYRYGNGRLILNTLHILEHIGRHPAADRLLLNIIAWTTGVSK